MQLSEDEEQRLAAITSGYARLRPGHSIDDVTAILGPPTSSRRLFSKTKRRGPVGISLEYRIASEGSLPNINDILVAIVFDNNELLVGAQPQNIPGLKPFNFAQAAELASTTVTEGS